MDKTDYLEALRRDGNALRESAVAAGLRAPVPACAGWSVADLVWHVTKVHDFWRSVIEQRASSGDQVAQLEPVDDDALFSAYDTNLDRLVVALRDTDSEVAVWTWSSSKDVGFVVRRMALETAVHRWDADHAAGRAVGIEPRLASDGIDEFLEHFIAFPTTGADPVGGSVHIHCTDTPGEWTVRPTEAGHEVTREHAKGDCALRGSASDLLLSLWRRLDGSSLDIVGDQAVATQFLATTDLE